MFQRDWPASNGFIFFFFRLSDEVPSVRQTAVTVLTQLVLKDVLKVKGQVSEVAVLLIDPEPHISSLALNFFNELATKVLTYTHVQELWWKTGPHEGFLNSSSYLAHQDNAIYNLLPDIISRLSDPERGMSSEDFNTIMKWVTPLHTQPVHSLPGPTRCGQTNAADVISGLLVVFVFFSDNCSPTSLKKDKPSLW